MDGPRRMTEMQGLAAGGRVGVRADQPHRSKKKRDAPAGNRRVSRGAPPESSEAYANTMGLVKVSKDHARGVWMLRCEVCGPLGHFYKYWNASSAAQGHEAMHAETD
jgi:hypothetical protein